MPQADRLYVQVLVSAKDVEFLEQRHASDPAVALGKCLGLG